MLQQPNSSVETTMQTPQEANTVWDLLSNYWYMWLFVGSIIFTVAQFQAKVTDLEAAVQAIQTEQTSETSQINAMSSNLSSINATLKDIQRNYYPASVNQTAI